MDKYCKRLIEVDLPIKRISAHARREKDMRRGHVPLLHIWPATRPTAACRAVICASLWPDPMHPMCHESFRETARKLMQKWATDYLNLAGEDSFKRLLAIQKNPELLDSNMELRCTLLDFIADFANWDNSTKVAYLRISRTLTKVAHETLGGTPGSKPLVVDPFAGGGAIPLESLRVGADTFSSELNPVAVLINKVVLEYIPKYGKRLIDDIAMWGEWIKKRIEEELAVYYPKDPDGSVPIAYIWARTIKCEGPGCGIQIPLMRSQLLCRKSKRVIALKFHSDGPGCDLQFEIREGSDAKGLSSGTIKRSSATCPACGYTTPATSVRKQMILQDGGAANARLMAVVTIRPGQRGRFYRLPTNLDLSAAREAVKELQRRCSLHKDALSLVPNEILPEMSGVFNAPLYGHRTWGSLFTPRQALTLSTFSKIIKSIRDKIKDDLADDYVDALCSC